MCLYFILILDPTRQFWYTEWLHLKQEPLPALPAVTKSNELTELEIQAKGAECVFPSKLAQSQNASYKPFREEGWEHQMSVF